MGDCKGVKSIETSFIEQFKSIKEENTKFKDLVTNYQEKVHSIQLKVNFRRVRERIF